jgi:hypothetical protein
MSIGFPAPGLAQAVALMVVLTVGDQISHAAEPGHVLEVGASRDLKTPSAAARVAQDGDKILVDAGEYYDCAVWAHNHLVIEGVGRAVLTDTTCQGKAIFVITGAGVTVRNLVFQRARVPDGNGAGIRAEGPDLTVESSEFVNNENGIMSGENLASHIVIRNSKFVANGKCDSACAHGIYIGKVALLHVEGSEFLKQKQGHHIKSRALRTEIVGNRIEDGPDGTASYLVEIPNGGSLILRDNAMEKGPNSENHSAAVSIGAEGVRQPTDEILVEHNKFRNDLGQITVFIRNGTATPAKLVGNILTGPVTPLVGDGTVGP